MSFFKYLLFIAGQIGMMSLARFLLQWIIQYSDMEDSLQSRNGHEKDFKKRFLSTFQRVRGYPKPSAASKQLAVVQVALVSRKSTTGGEETLLEKLE